MIEENLEKENEIKRKNASLTHSEWMTFFFLPFFSTSARFRDDHFSESELERFKKYGFEKKINEAKKAKRFGFIFWTIIILVIIVVFNFYDKI